MIDFHSNMSGAKENYINCQESIENENCLADSDTLNASLLEPLVIPNFKQPNAPDVHNTSLQLQRRIINLESQVEQLKTSESLLLLKIKQLKDEICI
uniref:Uncharacterized protein n=1 Tax=Meloidogyne enterolobii TaxID=390850 RepID=A0A6V7UYQ0_MELEN|nr:unnamed protein product [Meloidogyne enterolobii]